MASCAFEACDVSCMSLVDWRCSTEGRSRIGFIMDGCCVERKRFSGKRLKAFLPQCRIEAGERRRVRPECAPAAMCAGTLPSRYVETPCKQAATRKAGKFVSASPATLQYEGSSVLQHGWHESSRNRYGSRSEAKEQRTTYERSRATCELEAMSLEHQMAASSQRMGNPCEAVTAVDFWIGEAIAMFSRSSGGVVNSDMQPHCPGPY